MRDHQLNLATKRMGYELVELEEILRTIGSVWMKGDNIPITVRPGRSLSTASGEPNFTAAVYYLIDEAENWINGLGSET
jgi:hypothetical protein